MIQNFGYMAGKFIFLDGETRIFWDAEKTEKAKEGARKI